VFRVVQEHQIRFPPEIFDCLLHGREQPYRLQGVFHTVRPRKVADFRGNRELRQEITGCTSQGLMRAEVEVVEAGVERCDAEVQCTRQQTAFVTRSV
jgi:hypothetical protein